MFENNNSSFFSLGPTTAAPTRKPSLGGGLLPPPAPSASATASAADSEDGKDVDPKSLPSETDFLLDFCSLQSLVTSKNVDSPSPYISQLSKLLTKYGGR